MKKYFLVVILALAAVFRLGGLTSSPPGLNWDEVSIGYNAYSILRTGRDEWGELLPLAFKAFGEVKLPGMIYASIPGIALFGTTDLGVRITPAIIGLLGVLVIYLLGTKLLGDKSYGHFAALLLAVSPWGVHFSRVSFEAGLAMVLTMLSVYFLLRAKENPRFYILAMLVAVFAVYTYNSVRILLPLLFLSYLILGTIQVTKSNLKLVLATVVAGLILLIPSIANLVSKDGQIRWNVVSVTGHKGFYDRVAESRGYMANLPGILPRLLQNKVTHYITTVGDNYVKTFSTEFLFFAGSTNTQRSVQGMGLLYLFELPLLIAGFIQLWQKSKSFKEALRVILPWLLLAGIPSAITTDSPSSVRALGLLPALLLVEAVGAVALLHFFRTKHLIIRLLGVFLILWNIGYFGYQLWLVYPVKYADDWQYGYRDAILYAKQKEAEVDHIYITAKYGEPYIYTLFYTGYDPREYQVGDVAREIDPTGWVHVSGFGKYHFTDFSGLQSPLELVARNKGKILMIDGFASLPGHYARDFVIKAPNWIDMFEATTQEGQAK